MIITYHFRIKDSSSKKKLIKMVEAVNFVWNYCNEVSIRSINYNQKWLSAFDLAYLMKGCSKELEIHSQTIQSIGEWYVINRVRSKKKKLAWRNKRSLGWIPFKSDAISIKNDKAIYYGHTFRFWKSRKIEGKIKTGSFNQDSRGRWYLNLHCEIEEPIKIKDNREVGIDLGLKTLATLSDGNKIERENITIKYASKLAMTQRARKKRQFRNVHAKIKNVRKDFNHKETTKLVNNYGKIFIGDISPSKFAKTRMSKSAFDANWPAFKSMLAYKAIMLGVEYKEVKEKFSTVTCSTCFERTGPSGLSALGVREWQCSNCGAIHDRDVNAAKNILRFGHESPIKGNLLEDANKKSILAVVVES